MEPWDSIKDGDTIRIAIGDVPRFDPSRVTVHVGGEGIIPQAVVASWITSGGMDLIRAALDRAEDCEVKRRQGSYLIVRYRGAAAKIDTRTSELVTSQGRVRRVVRVLP